MRVKHETGASIFEVSFVLLNTYLCYYLWFSILAYKNSKLSFWKQSACEFVVYVLPLVFTFNYPHYIYFIDLSIIILALCLNKNTPDFKLFFHKKDPVQKNKKYLNPVISCYRTTVMTITIFSILACDFVMFPDRFRKMDYYGYSIMDVGVGAFVFSAGLVSNNSLLKSRKYNIFYRTYIQTRKQLPLILLGLLRMGFVKYFSYGVNVLEYGTVWNFYFTLAMVYLFAEVVDSTVKDTKGVGILLIAAYELALYMGLGDYIMNADRVGFFSSNREGIISILGYTAIFMMAKDYGKILNNPNATKNTSVVAGIFFILYVVICVVLELSVSRRLVNMGYFFWMCATHMVGIWILQVCKSIFDYSPSHIILSESINLNGLLVFLIANIFTGLINLNYDTKKIGTPAALATLILYMLVSCLISLYLAIPKVHNFPEAKRD